MTGYNQVISSVCYQSVVQPVDEEDLRDVRSAVADLAGSWKDLGISLGIRSSKLDAILYHSASNCLREMLTLWLRQSYRVSVIIIVTLFSH